MKIQFFYCECTSQAIKVKQRALNVSTTMNRVIIEEIRERKYPDKSMAKKVLIKTNKKYKTITPLCSCVKQFITWVSDTLSNGCVIPWWKFKSLRTKQSKILSNWRRKNHPIHNLHTYHKFASYQMTKKIISTLILSAAKIADRLDLAWA